jgi:4-amino-4-deoxy-L-arabinose transferase-like glycosyltransferase
MESKRLALGLCLLFLLDYGAFISFDLDKPYSQDWDEGLYLCSARMAQSGYPYFTYIFNSQAPLFLEILTHAFRLLGDSVVVGRSTIVFFSLVCLIGVAWIAWRVACPLAAPLAMVVQGLSSAYFRQSTIVEAEIVALSFALLAIGMLLSAEGKRGPYMLVGAGFIFCAGALCKLYVVPMILPIILLLMSDSAPEDMRFARARKWRLLRQASKRLFLFGGGCAICCAFALIRWDFASMYDQVVAIRFVAHHVYSDDGPVNIKVIMGLLVQDAVLPLLAGTGLVFLYWKRTHRALWLIAWILAAGVFLNEHKPLFHRHILLLQPPMAVSAGASILWIPSLSARYGRSVTWCVLGILLLVVLGVMLKQDAEVLSKKTPISQTEEEVGRLIRDNSRPSDYVVTDQQMDVFLAGRRIPPQLCDTSAVRIKTGYLTDQTAIQASRTARLVIFATGRLDQLPHYVRWVEANYRLIADLKQGTRIYLQK